MGHTVEPVKSGFLHAGSGIVCFCVELRIIYGNGSYSQSLSLLVNNQYSIVM